MKNTENTCMSEIPEYVEKLANGVDERLTDNFNKFLQEQNWRNVDAANKLSPCITDESHVSKLCSGKRKVSLDLLVVLHEVYKVDLNEWICGDKVERPALLPRQIAVLKEIVAMYDDSAGKN